MKRMVYRMKIDGMKGYFGSFTAEEIENITTLIRTARNGDNEVEITFGDTDSMYRHYSAGYGRLMLKHAAYSFKDVQSYDELTDDEKRIFTESEFSSLREHLKACGLLPD